MDEPQEGTSASRYTILGRLAGGGMADIYLARASTAAGVERYVVLKRVLAEHSRNAQFARMFLDEARLAAQLHHPNIAQVLDVGTLAGSYFFTMEYVHGKDVRVLLHRLVTQHRMLPVTFALHVAAGALAALHHAHERTGADNVSLGVVHRDVSPSNVIVSYEGVVKLLDFGVAKAAQNTSETRSGAIKGKIAYLSPEQCRGAAVDRRSDIFALGIVLHEMLTCRRLYRRESDFVTMEAIVRDPAPAPSIVRADISPALDQLVLRALAKDPARRFATAADMLEAIEAVASRERHVLSATAMGRFMRELFGERKEPWFELPEPGELTTMTVTAESLAALEAPDSRQRALEVQLEEAPLLTGTDASPSNDAELTPAPSLPALPALRVRRRRWTAVAILALVATGAAAAIFIATREPAHVAAPAEHDARLAIRDVPLDARAPVADAAGPDAAVADATLADAAVAAARTIAEALAAADWVATLELCVATPRLSDADRVQCGVAACNAKQASVAIGYHAVVPASGKAVIERACQIHGIVLGARPRPHADPCETDPLACRK